jgi:transcriptional regulator with XRE-family HTH domain
VLSQLKTKIILVMSIQARELPLFATRLKAAREKTGISQMDLGVKAGIDEYSASARINQYERGKHTPDFSTACNLAKVLGIPAAYFYAEDETLAELITIFAKLDSSAQKSLLASVS